MKKVTVFTIVLFLSACYGMADYNGPPAGALGDGSKPVDPEVLHVDPKSYPVFHVINVVIPPQPKFEYKPELVSKIPMVEILPTDQWHVTHKWGSYFLVTSETYDQRQCESQKVMGPGTSCARALFSEKYEPQHFYAIYLDKDGNISGGWKQLANPKRIVLSSERKTYFNPSNQGNIGWEKVSFEKIK